MDICWSQILVSFVPALLATVFGAFFGAFLGFKFSLKSNQKSWETQKKLRRQSLLKSLQLYLNSTKQMLDSVISDIGISLKKDAYDIHLDTRQTVVFPRIDTLCLEATASFRYELIDDASKNALLDNIRLQFDILNLRIDMLREVRSGVALAFDSIISKIEEEGKELQEKLKEAIFWIEDEIKRD